MAEENGYMILTKDEYINYIKYDYNNGGVTPSKILWIRTMKICIMYKKTCVLEEK